MSERLAAARALLRIAWTADRPRSVAVFVLGAVEALSASLFALWLKLILDGVAEGESGTVTWATAAAIASVVGSAAAGQVRSTTVAVLTERARHLLDQHLLVTVGGTPSLEIHEAPEHQTQLELLEGREAWVFGEVIPSLVGLVTLVIRVVATCALLAAADPLLLLLPLFGIPSLVLSPRVGAAVVAGDDLAAEPKRRLDHLFDLATGAAAAKEVRLFGLGEELLERFADLHRRHRRQRLGVHATAAGIGAGGRLVFLLGYLGATVLAVQQAVAGVATVGDTVLVAVLAGQVLGLVMNSAEMVGWVGRGLGAAGRYVYCRPWRRQPVLGDHRRCRALPSAYTRGSVSTASATGISGRVPMPCATSA